MNAKELLHYSEEKVNTAVIDIIKEHRENTASMAKEILQLRAEKRSMEEKSATQSMIAEEMRADMISLKKKVREVVR